MAVARILIIANNLFLLHLTCVRGGINYFLFEEKELALQVKKRLTLTRKNEV